MAEKSSRILIFGGTFDPPHVAHTTLPAMAADILDCQRIIYVPAACNPLKPDGPAASDEHRLAMLSLAIADVAHAEISTIEIERGGASYTIDTLQTLRKQLGKHAIMRLLIGSDQALEFTRWKDWQKIVELAEPAVMVRPPWNRDSLERELQARNSKEEAARWLKWTLRLPLMDVTATVVRQRLERGESLEGLLPPAVIEYIGANRLYGPARKRPTVQPPKRPK